MRRFFTASTPLLILLACGPKGAGESDTGGDETSTGGTSDAPGDSTGDAPTGTTGDTPTGTTGTDTSGTETTETTDTGDEGQPIFCDGAFPKAACVKVCARDVDPQTPIVDANCRVTEPRMDTPIYEVPPCILVADEWEAPAGEEACFAVRVDKTGNETPSKLDDMSTECVDDGHNAEIALFRSTPPLKGACAFVTCEPSPKPVKDCPIL